MRTRHHLFLAHRKKARAGRLSGTADAVVVAPNRLAARFVSWCTDASRVRLMIIYWRSILRRKGDQPRAPPAPNCAHEARCAPSAARGEPAWQSLVRPNQRIGEAAPTCAHLRPGGGLRTSSCPNVSRRGVTLPRENAADIAAGAALRSPEIAAAASSKI